MCGGQRHRITWRRGKLVLEDHDLLAERSLTALGSEPPLCMEVLEAWRRVRDSDLLHGLLVGDRTVSSQELALRRSRFAAVNLRRALALSVLVGFGRRWNDGRFGLLHHEQISSALAAIAKPLFEQSVRRWRRNLKPHAPLEIGLRLLSPTGEPACSGWVDNSGAFAVLSLPTSWFTDLWARGIALVDGCFVLRHGGSCHASSFPVLAVRWQREGGGASVAREAPAVVSTTPDGERCMHWT